MPCPRLLTTVYSLALSLHLTLLTHAQEWTQPLPYDPFRKKLHASLSTQTHTQQHKQQPYYATLPFMDDFSQPSYSYTLWDAHGVYFNTHYADHCPTWGVATLDGLNALGLPYNPTPNSWGPADTLLSPLFNLQNKQPADSIFLSFFYQAGGLGDIPAYQDSLILQFRTASNQWITVWTAYGGQATPFQLVLIPITQTQFLHDSFQFRFINFATLSGNNDHWHLDVIYLDQNRTRTDSTILDVAIADMPTAWLNRYTIIPWRFAPYFWNNSLFVALQNLSNATRNTSYRFVIEYPATSQRVDSSLIAAFNLLPQQRDTLWMNLQYLTATFSPINTTSVHFRVWYEIQPGSGNLYHNNDTLAWTQHFTGMLAYDDGTPERAYGLIGAGTAFAYQYQIPNPDTLWGIAIQFVPHNADIQQFLFSIAVWTNLSTSIDQNLIARRDFLTPCLPDSLPDTLFCIYLFPEPVPVPTQFYAGWIQTTPEPLLVGLDQNRNARPYAWYYAASQWLPSQVNGAILFRPIIGTRQEVQTYLLLSTSHQSPDPFTSQPQLKPQLYPANAPTLLYFPQTITATWLLTTSHGIILQTGTTHGEPLTISIAHLPPGIYLLHWIPTPSTTPPTPTTHLTIPIFKPR